MSTLYIKECCRSQKHYTELHWKLTKGARMKIFLIIVMLVIFMVVRVAGPGGRPFRTTPSPTTTPKLKWYEYLWPGNWMLYVKREQDYLNLQNAEFICTLSSDSYGMCIYGHISIRINHDRTDFFKSSRECLLSNIDANSNDLERQWTNFPYYVNKCAPKNRLPVQGFSNTDELKFHVMPRSHTSNSIDCTIISLGIGKDVEAEKSMRVAMPNCQFWGADPVNDTNADIFPEVGKFYNIAVGAENGSFRSYILEDIYRYQDVKYIDIATFIRNYVKKSVIDQIMIDIEHAEYPMLPFLLQTGQLAKESIVICQMNIEVHRPNSEQLRQFFNFYKQLMLEEQWTLMSASSIIGHLRLFMFNHGNQECHDRYVGDIYDRSLANES
ncbi:unnamed protein product [Cylicocyclus nassatus]|uniref:Methyltransferase FkbM domain-containing protein n=1 Tax=Cylicocyclus nassatus TaxID=53992 RepID=A0AA36GPK2_CYLNA|nr:unnamed protein product [Cylicocyclus nassatus]